VRRHAARRLGLDRLIVGNGSGGIHVRDLRHALVRHARVRANQRVWSLRGERLVGYPLGLLNVFMGLLRF
jgi:hypothetical protein